MTLILSETFAPPRIATKGRCGLLTASPRNFSSFWIRKPMPRGFPGNACGDAEGAGVLAVGGAESVVDIDIAQLGEVLGEIGVVLFLLLVEAEVFQEQNLAVLEFRR